MYGFPRTALTDVDYYSIGLCPQLKKKTIYPEPKIHQRKLRTNIDVDAVELAAFFTYLMNGFILKLEALYVPSKYVHTLNDQFKELVLDKKHLFINRVQILENLTSNIYDVKRRTIKDIENLRVKVLQRNTDKKALDGVDNMLAEHRVKNYYHKDYINSIRLAANFLYFLKNGVYPVELENYDKTAFDFCKDIKLNPNKFSREALDQFLDSYLENIDAFNFDGDDEKFRFDACYAQKVIDNLYA